MQVTISTIKVLLSSGGLPIFSALGSLLREDLFIIAASKGASMERGHTFNFYFKRGLNRDGGLFST